MTAGADRWIRWTTIVSVALLALIAGTVSYLHMHTLVARHGQPGWVAALTPFSVDGMIVAASTTLLADSRSGQRGGVLPWALLVAGSVASLLANVAVAEPTLIGRIIAAWPSFALTASYELLTRQVRRSSASTAPGRHSQRLRTAPASSTNPAPAPSAELRLVRPPELGKANRTPVGVDLQGRAWQWALAHRAPDGSLPSGSAIAAAHGRHERWGRLVKKAGQTGTFGPPGRPQTGLPPLTRASRLPGRRAGDDAHHHRRPDGPARRRRAARRRYPPPRRPVECQHLAGPTGPRSGDHRFDHHRTPRARALA